MAQSIEVKRTFPLVKILHPAAWAKLSWGAGSFALFAMVGMFFILNCPPLWRDYDGLIQISSRPSDMTVLQYPAAYPFFSRLHVYVAQKILDRIHHKKTQLKVTKGVMLNDPGIHALMISQEMALALALAMFVSSCARTPVSRWAVALLLISNASLFVIADLVSTEALSEAIIIALIAIGFALFRAAKPSVVWFAGYGVCLYAAIMTRHTNSILAMILPTAWIMKWMLEWIRTRQNDWGAWRLTAISIAVGLGSIGASNVTTRILCGVFDVPFRSISARATVERLGFVDQMSQEEKEQFLHGLQSKSSDPVVVEAIPALARSASWVQQRDEIQSILRRHFPEMDEKAIVLKSDAYMDLVAGMFYRTWNRHLIAGTVESIRWALMKATAPDVSEYYLKTGAYSIDLYASDPDLKKKTSALEVCSPASKARIQAFDGNWWVRFWGWAPFGAVFIVAAAAAVVMLVRGTGDSIAPIFALSLSVTGVIATCLTFVLVNYIPRFAAAADQFAFLALAVVLAHGIDARKARKAEAVEI